MDKINDRKQQWKVVEKLLKETIRNWRMGDDHTGLQTFIQFLNQLQSIQEPLPPLNSAFGKLLDRMIDYDMVAMIDILEYQTLPLIEQWPKDVNDHE